VNNRIRYPKLDKPPNAARSQFSWAAPGQSIEKLPADRSTTIEPELEINKNTPVANFCLVVVQPWQVDHLQLSRPQRRSIYQRDRQGNWSQQQVNP
jgi:pyridoxamine 5'-phosphate oxidase